MKKLDTEQGESQRTRRKMLKKYAFSSRKSIMDLKLKLNLQFKLNRIMEVNTAQFNEARMASKLLDLSLPLNYRRFRTYRSTFFTFSSKN